MNAKHYAILLVVMVVLFALPLIILPHAEFGGADGNAADEIESSGYEPWITPFWEPPSGEIESLLFSVQAAIGAVIIGYFVGYERGKRAQLKAKKSPPE